MKWVCCGVSEAEKKRFEKLQAILAAQGAQLELSFADWKPDEDLLTQFAGAHHVRWGESIQDAVMRTITIQSSWTALLGVSDGMIFRDNRWWPLCAVYEAICETLIGLGKGLDLQASAFIGGSGPTARAAIAALFKCGFRKFRLACETSDDAKKLLEEMRLKFFGIDIKVVAIDTVVMLAGVSSIFINTTSQAESPTLTQELSYLNFLKRPGAVIDTTLFIEQSVLLKEASDSAIPTIDGWQIAARADVLWANWAFSLALDEAKFLASLRT